MGRERSREEWLLLALQRIRKEILPELPEVTASIGFPSRGATSIKRRTIGQCWSGGASSDGKPAIFVSPVVKTAAEALSVLAHEACHAASPKAGHGPAFQKLCARLGLVKPGTWASAKAGPALAKRLNALVPEPFGHSAITVLGMTKKQSTRLLKVECPEDGYTVRVTRKWLNELGAPICPCGSRMEAE